MSDGLRLALVGPGAIGTTVAAALTEVGRPPALYGRSPRAELLLRDDDGGQVVVPGPVRTVIERAERADLVFLAVKATQLEAAAPWLARLCGPETVVCVLQNGVEQRELVRPLTAGGPVVPAVVWFPAVRDHDDVVWLRGAARLTIPEEPGSAAVTDVLRGSRCTVEVADDFVSAAWRKLLQNAAAGLMVLTGRSSGVFSRVDLGELTLAYLREALTVARAEGAELDDDVPQAILDGFRGRPPDLSSSILVDRRAGRPLEWDVRNGVIPRKAGAHGIATPISDLVVPLLAAAGDGPG